MGPTPLTRDIILSKFRNNKTRNVKIMGTVQAKILEIIADEPFTTREELIKDYGIKYSSGSHSIVGPLQALVRRQFLSEKNGSFVITDKGTEMLTKIRAGEIRLHTGRGVTHASK